MKPVTKGGRQRRYAKHGDAKPDLAHKIGEFCSYCESASGSLQNLDVEHIYSQHAHPGRSRNWSNFLLACSSCNTYKAQHLGNGRLLRLFKRCYWPHLDNTFNAFEYHPDGLVTIKAGVGGMAQELMNMTGLLISPAVAPKYHALGLSYDGIKRRERAWQIAENALIVYREHPSSAQVQSIVNTAVMTGFFSIWMGVFDGVITMRLLFIEAFKADPACFDRVTSVPTRKGRI